MRAALDDLRYDAVRAHLDARTTGAFAEYSFNPAPVPMEGDGGSSKGDGCVMSTGR